MKKWSLSLNSLLAIPIQASLRLRVNTIFAIDPENLQYILHTVLFKFRNGTMYIIHIYFNSLVVIIPNIKIYQHDEHRDCTYGRLILLRWEHLTLVPFRPRSTQSQRCRHVLICCVQSVMFQRSRYCIESSRYIAGVHSCTFR